MYRCQQYLKNIGFFAGALGFPHRLLTGAEAGNGDIELREDGAALLYTSAVAIADALRGIKRGFYTWSTVKLYYSAFYTARSALALGNRAVVYGGNKPFTLDLMPGAQLSKIKGRSHDVILDELEKFWAIGVAPPFAIFASQDIGLEPPFEWLRHRREDANYNFARCSEPVAPDHLKRIAGIGIRRAVASYLSDGGDNYLFDPDHAMLCFPLRFWSATLAEARSAGWTDIVGGQGQFLREVFQDQNGPLPDIYKLLEV